MSENSGWLERLAKRALAAGGVIRKYDVPPSPDEMHAAVAALQQSLRPAAIGELGGIRPPDKNDRRASWWGCNFLARVDEDIPVCSATGHAMHPVLQVRIADLPVVPPPLAETMLLQLWLDFESKLWFESTNRAGFCVRTYDCVEDLVPLGPGYREDPTFPSLPILWSIRTGDTPDWSDFVDKVPERVAWSRHSDWFFDAADHSDKDEAPVKVGGWPSWIQDSTWPESAEFVMQVNSTTKGSFGFGDAGSIYLFRRGDEWLCRGDMY